MALREVQHGALHEALLDALAFVLPVDCAGCGAPDRALCAACRVRLEPEPGSHLAGPGLRVWWGLRYEGVPRQVILGLKRDGRTGLARALVPALAAAVVAAAPDPAGIRIVAIPGTRAGFRRRGFDPVRLLLARAGLTPWRVFAPARPHLAQKRLGVQERDRNLRGAFRVSREVAGHRILLVDDVVTSGATLREAARALHDAGAEVIGAAVVASTPLRARQASRDEARPKPRAL
ncbi:MAG: ComF family protein [Microbacteriaceae bacterium]|nr:ComF family protein [Microbacteriaceae bacterium]